MNAPSVFSATVARIRRRGLLGTVQCQLERLWLSIWQRVFGFDAWHVGASYSYRAYKKQVVEIVNALRPTTVVELGCGLGDIISRIQAPRRVGVDIDARVIRAARFLHPIRTRWIHGSADVVKRVIPAGDTIDCVIMVNWIHSLNPEQLAALVLPMLPKARYLLLDAIHPDGPASYRFKHDFAFLEAHAQCISTTRAVREPRSFLLFKIVR